MNRNWEYKKLGDVCVSELGKTLNQSKDTGSLRPYLCAVNVQWDSLDFTTLKQARFEEDELERYSVQKNDLLVCEGGDVGRAAIWNQEKPMLYQNALHRLRFSNNCNPRFYLFCLKHLKNKGVLDSRYAKGVTIKHLVKSALLSIQVPIPPLSEQSRIVAELDLLTGIIDKQNAQLKELDNLAQAIFYDMFGDPIENPKRWDVKNIGDIADVKIGPFGSLLHASDYINGGHPVINPVHLKAGKIIAEDDFTVNDDMYAQMMSYVLHKNDIVFGRRGDIGRCALVTQEQDGYLCGTGSLFVRFNIQVQPLFSVATLMHKSITDFLLKKAKGATMLNINCGIVEDIPFILPPLTLQQSFAEKIQSIEKQKETIRASIADTQKLLDYTMDKYFG